MKTGKAITIFSVLFSLAFLAGQSLAAEGHNWDANVLALTGGTTVDCNNCHLQSHTDADGGGFVPHGEVVYDRCYECHKAGGPAGSKIVVGNHKTDGSVDCGFCHEVHDTSTTLETTSTNSRPGGGTGKNLSYIRSNMQTAYMTALKGPNSASTNTVFQSKPDDYAFDSAFPDAGDPAFPYNGVCQACHSATNHHTQALQAAGDDHKMGINCAICHQHTYTNIGKNKAFIPYHPDTHFGWDAECQRCHSNIEIDAGSATEGVVSFVHKFNCGDCHTVGNNPTLANATRATANGDASQASGAAAAGFNPATYTCKTCHIQNVTSANLFHGYSVAAVGARHQISSNSSRGYDCQACHGHDWTTGDAQITRHMPAGADSAARCATSCHNGTAGNISARSGVNNNTLVKNGTINIDPNPNAFKCESCHVAKGDFTMHGLADDDSSDDGMDNECYSGAKGSCGTGEVVSHNNLGPALGQAPTYTGKLAGAYGGVKVTKYDCDDCHSGNRTAATTLEAMTAHTLGKNGTTCLTCHANNIADFENVVDKGKANTMGTLKNYTGALNTTVNCEDCHATTVNGDVAPGAPYGTGKQMSQYDGKRHHTTDHPQAGNCTWCHASPLPAVPTMTGGYAATATAASSNSGLTTYNTGWPTDFGVSCPDDPTIAGTQLPTQLACRLCHTNYGTDGAGTAHSVNTLGGNGPHGYNIDGYSGTLTERTKGLTVYANDFNAGPSGASNNTTATVNATRLTQTVLSSHRIDANNGNSLIKVYDYGACLGCHSVQVMHAAPVPGVDYPALAADYGVIPWDTLRYAPGRGVFNELRGVDTNNNQAWNDHRLRNENGLRTMVGSSQAKTRGKSYIQGAQSGTGWYFGGSVAHTDINPPLNAAFSNFENLTQGTGLIPPRGIVFDAITPPAVADDVRCLSASWDGANVTVEAMNDDGCGALSVNLTGSANPPLEIAVGGMTGIPCTGSFALGSLTPLQTIDILTTNLNGTDAQCVIQDNSNIIPVAADDTFNTTYTVAIDRTVATNDTPGEAPNTWALVTDVPAGQGTLTFNDNGTFTYNPGVYVGVTSFTYTITDATPDISTTATVSITVTDLTPDAVDDTVNVSFGNVYNGNVSTNDTPGDAPNTWAVVTGLPGDNTKGILTFSSNGAFTYDDNGYLGSTSFTYNITDANGSTDATPATVTITVDVIPVPVDDTVDATEGSTLNGDVSGNDALGDAPNTWNLVADVGQGTLDFTAGNGTFTYDPPAPYTGGDFQTTFTYNITDATPDTSDTATVTITVNALPTPVDDSFSTQVATAVSGNVAANDDLGSGLDSTWVVTGPSNGSLGAGLAANGDFTYTPNPGWSGTDTFTYRITDTTPDVSATFATVTITVSADEIVACRGNWTPGTAASNKTVTVDQAITRVADGTGATGTGNFNYAINDPGIAGEPRTLVVFVALDDDGGNRDPAFAATWGGQSLAIASETTVSARSQSAILYLNEAGITAAGGSGTRTLNVSWPAGGSNFDNYQVYAGTLLGVDQTSVAAAITDFAANVENNVGDSNITFGSNVQIAEGDRLLYIVNVTRSGETINTPAGYTILVNNDSPRNMTAEVASYDSTTADNPGPNTTITMNNNNNYKSVAAASFNAAAIPATTATLDVIAMNTTGVTNQVYGDYNGSGNFNLNNTGGNNWQQLGYTNSPATDSYAATMQVTSAGDLTGLTCTVTNNAGAPSFNDVVTGATVSWTGNVVTVTNVTNNWNNSTQAYITYNGTTYDLSWNVGGFFEATITPETLVANATVTTAAGGSLLVAVTDTTDYPPAFTGEPYTDTAKEGVAKTSTVPSATDPNGDPITYSRTGGTCTGTAGITVNPANGDISFTPHRDDIGTCTVNIQASSSGGTDAATVTFTVSANTPPAPLTDGNDTFSVVEGSGVNNLTGMLTNDSDGGDGGALTIDGVSAVAGAGCGTASAAIGAGATSVDFNVGTAAAGSTCTFTYTNFDTFYTSAPATGTVTVNVTSAVTIGTMGYGWSNTNTSSTVNNQIIMYIDPNNPAVGTGTLTEARVYINAVGNGTIYVATINPTTWVVTDISALLPVSTTGLNTFTSLSLSVNSGDWLAVVITNGGSTVRRSNDAAGVNYTSYFSGLGSIPSAGTDMGAAPNGTVNNVNLNTEATYQY